MAKSKKRSITKPDENVMFKPIGTWREIPRFRCLLCDEIFLGTEAMERHREKHRAFAEKEKRSTPVKLDRYGVPVKGGE